MINDDTCVATVTSDTGLTILCKRLLAAIGWGSRDMHIMLFKVPILCCALFPNTKPIICSTFCTHYALNLQY